MKLSQVMAAFIVSACLTQQQAMNMVCDNLCRYKAESGFFGKNKHCKCVTDEGEVDDFARGQMKIDAPNFSAPAPVETKREEYKY